LDKKNYRFEKYFLKDAVKPLKTRVLEKVKAAGKRIQEKDLDEWLRSSTDESDVWKSLDQILLAVGQNVEISRLQLEPYFGFELDTSMYALSNALARRDRAKVLSLIHQAYEIEEEAPEVILAKIIGFFVQLQVFRSLIDRIPFDKRRFTRDRSGIYNFPDSFLDRFRQEGRPGVEKEWLSKHSYVLKVYLSAALDYGSSDLAEWLRELELADERIKSTPVDRKHLLEGLVMRLLGKYCEVKAS